MTRLNLPKDGCGKGSESRVVKCLYINMNGILILCAKFVLMVGITGRRIVVV